MLLTPVKDITEKSDYSDKLLKLIPGEVVAAYITIAGIIPSDPSAIPTAKWVSLCVAIVLLLSIPLYLNRMSAGCYARQKFFTMIAFIIWLYSLGGPFKLWAEATGVEFHIPYIGSILLILWTVLIPYAFPTGTETAAGTETTPSTSVSLNH